MNIFISWATSQVKEYVYNLNKLKCSRKCLSYENNNLMAHENKWFSSFYTHSSNKIVLFRWYLTRELNWLSQSSISLLKMIIFALCSLLFENSEKVSVSLLMLSAKQGNHWYHFFNVWYDAASIRDYTLDLLHLKRALYH